MENHKLSKFFDGVYVYQTRYSEIWNILKYTNVLVTQNIWPMDGNEIGVVEYLCPLTVYTVFPRISAGSLNMRRDIKKGICMLKINTHY